MTATIVDTAVRHVAGRTFAELIATADRPIVVDFWADWCAPCKQLAPAFEKLARARIGQAIFAKVDTSADLATAGRYQIMQLPTVLILEPRTGEVLDELRGGATERLISRKLDRVLGLEEV